MQSGYQSILVPLDGSAPAEHALPIALSIARRHKASLHLVRIYVPLAGVAGEYAMPYDAALDRELMRQSQEYLADVVARIESADGIRATAALREGPIAEAIAHHAAAVKADLLVMTTQGRGPLGRFWLGSVSDELVREHGIPILLVPPKPSAPSFAQQPGIRRVLVPLDGSQLAELVLEPLLALWDPAQTEYTLLRIVTPAAEPNYSTAAAALAGLRDSASQLQDRDEAESKRAHAYLEQLAAQLRTRSFNVRTLVIPNERPANGILDAVTVHGADLIALATRGRGGLRRLILGSVADKVLRGAEIPVLTYRPAEVASPPRATVPPSH
jgi:nucleotide-binding universal stress UspA family protein